MVKHISPTRCVPASILEGKATFQSRAYIPMVKGNWSNYILRDMRWDWVETKHRSLENLTSLSWLPLILNDISDKLFPNRRRALQLIEVGGGLRRPVWPGTRQPSLRFSTGLRARGLMAHYIKQLMNHLLEMKEKKVLKDIKKIFAIVMSVLFFHFEVRIIGMEQN